MRRSFEKYVKRIRKFFLLKILYPLVYVIHALQPLKENRVIFVENYGQTLSSSFYLLHKRLKETGNFEISVHYLRMYDPGRLGYLARCLSLVGRAAGAKYVFLSDALNIFGCIPIRKGSIYTQLWHGCGALKRFGFSALENGFDSAAGEMRFYPNYSYADYMTVSSPQVIWAYHEATGLPAERIIAAGISRTDLFYDREFLARARDRFWELMPEADGKRVILYAPTFRGEPSLARAPRGFSISRVYEKLADTCVLVVKHHPLVGKRPDIPERFAGFAKDLSDFMSAEELLCVADLCITDYSSLIFEYALFEKPMIFYASDLEEYCGRQGFFYDYRNLVPGSVCADTEELVSYAKDVKAWFDAGRIAAFRKTFMASCDGHATWRIIETVFREDMDKF